MDFSRKLQRLHEARNTAAKVGSTECQKCGFCCWRMPGGLHPENVLPLAKRMNMTPGELFSKCLTVHDMGKYDDKYAVIPIRYDQRWEAGGYLSDKGSFDIDRPCMFLDEATNLCTLHGTDAQPADCSGEKPCTITEYRDDRPWTPEMLMETFGFDIHAAKSCDYDQDSDNDDPDDD
jgi:Fe-S-cluster containining protein